jgi:hypothetical protein
VPKHDTIEGGAQLNLLLARRSHFQGAAALTHGKIKQVLAVLEAGMVPELRLDFGLSPPCI